MKLTGWLLFSLGELMLILDGLLFNSWRVAVNSWRIALNSGRVAVDSKAVQPELIDFFFAINQICVIVRSLALSFLKYGNCFISVFTPLFEMIGLKFLKFGR